MTYDFFIKLLANSDRVLLYYNSRKWIVYKSNTKQVRIRYYQGNIWVILPSESFQNRATYQHTIWYHQTVICHRHLIELTT